MSSDESDLDRVLSALRPTLDITPGSVSGWFTPQPEHRGNPGWLHGGFAAAVLDHVSARAAASVLGGPVVTGTLNLRFPSPVSIEDGPFEVSGSAEAPRGRVTRTRAVILGRDKSVLVQAKGLFLLRDPS